MRNRPRHDIPGPRKDLYGAPERQPSRTAMLRFEAELRRRLRRGRPDEPEPLPIDPTRPQPLAGGAAATPE